MIDAALTFSPPAGYDSRREPTNKEPPNSALQSPLFEIAILVVRRNHVAGFIECRGLTAVCAGALTSRATESCA